MTEEESHKLSKGPILGVRHVQVVMLFLAMVICFFMRVSMSMAIVVMTDKDTEDPFDWSMQIQSVILSSFFWGYIVLQIPSGEIAARFGGKILLTICIAVNSAVSLLIPLGAYYGGWQLLCACRVLQGLSQGCLYPTMHNQIGKWVPVQEKSRLGTLIYGGALIGTAIQMMVSGFIADYWGWPTIFYVNGALGAIWVMFYVFLGSSSPQSSKMIGNTERLYIQTSLGQVGEQKRLPTPWKKLATNLSFISLIVVHCGHNWGYWTLMTEIPSYMKQVLGVDIKAGGWVAACNAMLFMGMSHACYYTVNQSLFEQWLPPNERKIFNHLIYGGIQIGIIIALPISGLLSSAALGWELVYYSLAMLALSMAIISGTLTASSPADHQAVGDAEKEFIKETLNSYRKKKINRPWRDILKSSHFWAVTSVHAASNAVFIFFIAYAPAYLMMYGISLEDSAWYSMLPFISMALVYIVLSPIIDWFYTMRYIHYIFSASFYRKVINGLGAFGIITGFTMLPNFSREWSIQAIITLSAILGLLGLQFCGFLSTYKDMSENYSGTLMMISCTVSSVVGAAVPFVSGLVLGDDMCNRESWRVIMLTLASVYIVSTVIYTTCGSNERQNWDHVNNNNKRRPGHYTGVRIDPQVQLEVYGHTNLALQKNEFDSAL